VGFPSAVSSDTVTKWLPAGLSSDETIPLTPVPHSSTSTSVSAILIWLNAGCSWCFISWKCHPVPCECG
jgi:hypothetical protein